MFLLGVIFLRNKQNKRYPPVAGTVLHQFINRHNLNQYMTELACKYTTYRMRGLFSYTVYTADPVNVEYLLKTNAANYGMGYLKEIMSGIYGDGIFTAEGDKWKRQRKASSSQFSTKVIRDFSREIFKANAVKLASIVKKLQPAANQ